MGDDFGYKAQDYRRYGEVKCDAERDTHRALQLNGFERFRCKKMPGQLREW